MQFPSMGAAYRNAFLQAPRPPVDASPQVIKNPFDNGAGMLDGRGLGRRAHGIGAPLSVRSNVPAKCGSDEGGACGFLSPVAKRFRALGVDSSDYDIQVKHDELEFKLSMEDESLRVGTKGRIDYSSNKIDLDVKLSTSEGVAMVDGREVRFKQVSFSLDFSWESLDVKTGSSKQEAFTSRKDEFLKAILEKVRGMAGTAMGEGGLDAASEDVDSFGKSLGERLFSLTQGVMDVGSSAPQRATYAPPKSPPSRERAGMDEARRAYLEEMDRMKAALREANEKAALIGAARPSSVSAAPTAVLDRSV